MTRKIDSIFFEHKGYLCRVSHLFIETDEAKILREKYRELGINLDWYCGYVKIPDTSRFYGVGYDELGPFITVHGGLTYSELEDDGYWIGFDCNHFDDNPFTQNKKYTTEQLKYLVDQLWLLETLETK